MLNSKEADFILRGDGEVVYPSISTDRLELYYDVKGKKNGDVHKDKLLDMSGQGKDGELSGFDYDGVLSGYDGDNGLVFDGIDDTLKMPKSSGIDANNFTYQLNNNILAFAGDEVKTVKNGEVEVGGRNLIKETDFNDTVHRNNYEWVVEDGETRARISYGSESSTTVYQPGVYTISFTGREMGENKEGNIRLSRRPEGGDSRSYSSIDYVPGGSRTSDEWKKIKYTFELLEPAEIGLQLYNNNRNNFYLKELKIEKGTTATDWTPAPEDLIETTDLKGNILGDMEDIVDASPRDCQSGKEVFTEHADDSHVRVEVDGQSYQRFDPNARNMVPTKYEDWLVDHDYNKEEGALAFHSNRMAASWLIEVESNKSYYYDTGNPDIWYVIRTLDSNKTIENESWGGSGTSGVKTTNSTTKYLGVGIYTISGLIIKDEFQAGNIKPIIQDASVTDRSFIEYVPKAPTPDYPVEIHSLNDFDVVSSAVRRNLVISSDVTPGHRIQSDGSIVRTYNHFITDFIEVKADEFYTITMLLQRGGYSRVAYYDLDKNFIKRDLFQNQEVTQIKPEQDGFIRWSPDADESIIDYDYLLGYKIELGPDHPLIDKINLSLSEPLRSVGSEDKIYPLQSLDDWSRYYKNSPAIVTNPSDTAYQKWGFDGVPLENMEQVKGGMFGGAFPIHGNLQGGIDAPGTAWAGINISRMYLETNDATLLTKIKAIGDFFLNHVMDIDIWGVPFKAMPNAVTFDEVSRQWIPSTRFIHTRTFYHVAWALLEIYDATKDTKYSNLAGQLLDGATIIQLIATGQANSNELPPYFSGAMFNAINNVGGASYEPDWVTFTNTSGDVVVRATNKWIKLFGNTTRTSFDLYEEVDVNYTVKSIADNYINHLVYLYNNQELRKPDGHNLLYCFSHYEWEDEPHPDGYMIPVPMNWDFIDGVFGKDQWFTGDLTFWTIIGFAEAGQETIATSLLDRYYELRKPDSEGRLLFHDRYTAGGTPLVEDTSKSITFTALYMQARNILGDHSYDSESLTALAYYQKKSEFNTVDGGFSWDTEDYNSFIENKSLGEITYSVMENASNRTPAPEDITEDTNHPLIDKVNPSLSEPLRSVGDVKDRIFRDDSDGLWKIERNVGELELKGTRGWSADSYRDEGYNYAYFRPINFKDYGEVRSNILPQGKIADDTRETVGKTVVIAFNLKDSRTGVSSTDTATNRVLKIRDYLFSIEGAMVSYELETPTTETLDQELQDQLNTLKSFKGSNYVYTVLQDDGLTPIIHAKTEVKDI